MNKKYTTEAERQAAKRKSKLAWYYRNKSKVLGDANSPATVNLSNAPTLETGSVNIENKIQPTEPQLAATATTTTLYSKETNTVSACQAVPGN